MGKIWAAIFLVAGLYLGVTMFGASHAAAADGPACNQNQIASIVSCNGPRFILVRERGSTRLAEASSPLGQWRCGRRCCPADQGCCVCTGQTVFSYCDGGRPCVCPDLCGGPSWSASSPTRTPSSASSARSCLNRRTDEPSSAPDTWLIADIALNDVNVCLGA